MQTSSLGWTFDTVASDYEKLRPGYVDELYQAIFDYIQINNKSRVVEIGIGGGQAALPFLKTGCKLTAVDYGESFCEICREKFKEYPNFSAVSGKFEDIDMGDKYDLIYSASAFHWIPEEIGYKKVYDMLKDGGVFARFANHPFRDKGKPELSAEMDKIYAEYYYKYYNKEPKSPVEYTDGQAYDRALIAEKYGFTDIGYKLFFRTRTFSAKEYKMLLGTYSDHIAIAESIRTKFFSEIEEAINRHGGEITIYDTIDLQLARKI
ncbi:MAG: class I SAM-dependent methyltransferase [Ruminococcaceae bacterium]|nr:class I SAM-dependent methyltransferase [Oscillospiraceae bacterium]